MKGIAIYVEGGGETAQQRAELRVGMDQLLGAEKQAARDKRLQWRVVFSGGRDSAFGAFENASRRPSGDQLCVLLVDSEGPIDNEHEVDPGAADVVEVLERNARARRDYLSRRDGWDFGVIEPETIHLMVQCMETWFVADPESLSNYYGTGFRKTALPVRKNLEEEPKVEVYKKLAKATRATKKGEYSEANHAKVTHAKEILGRIDPNVIADRSSRFATFIEWLRRRIDEA
jgi:hypothetical protein